MQERHDKELFKSVTVRFSYIDENHGNLIEKLAKESEERNISKNKLILECIAEHFQFTDQKEALDSITKEYRESLEKDRDKIKDEIKMEVYQELIKGITVGFMNSGFMMPNIMHSKTSNEIPEEKTENVDFSDDTNIMDNIMKWS